MEPLTSTNNNLISDPLRDLFEACKTGDIVRVRKLVNPQTVNARDTAGRKSTPLHFAAGMYPVVFYIAKKLKKNPKNYLVISIFSMLFF